MMSAGLQQHTRIQLLAPLFFRMKPSIFHITGSSREFPQFPSHFPLTRALQHTVPFGFSFNPLRCNK